MGLTALPPAALPPPSRRSVNIFEAAWGIPAEDRARPSYHNLSRSQSASQLTLWSPVNDSRLGRPAARHMVDETFIAETPMEAKHDTPADWQADANLSPFDCVTLRDGRVAERDATSGHWKWRTSRPVSWIADDGDSTWPLNEKTPSSTEHPLPQDLSKYSSSAPSIIQQPQAPSQPPSTNINFSQSSRPHELAFVFCVCLAQFLALAGLAQTVAPLPVLGKSFGVSDPGTLSWYTAAYSLTVGTFILPAGRIGDMLGHKRVYILGWIWFAVWSIITGFSFKSSSVVFTICRALQGIGPAFIVPNAMALIGITFPMGKKRNIIFAVYGACGPTGFVAGSLFSALLAQLAWWPWSFFCMGIACAFVACFASLIIPAATKRSPLTITGKFDFPGALTGICGLVLINFAFNEAPLVGWSDLYIPVLLIAGLAVMGVFIFVELKVAESPLIPLRGLSKEGGFALACIAAGWGSHGIWLYYFFLFAERLRGHSPLAAAAQICPVAVTGAIFAVSTGILVKKVKVAYIMCIAMFGFLIGLVLLVAAPVGQTYWALTFISVLITPIGMNLSFPSGTILLSNAMPREHQGVAASLISTMVNYSISTGLGIAGTVDRYVTAAQPDPTSIPATLVGYRSAWGFGMGLASLGIAISCYFIYTSWHKRA